MLLARVRDWNLDSVELPIRSYVVRGTRDSISTPEIHKEQTPQQATSTMQNISKQNEIRNLII